MHVHPVQVMLKCCFIIRRIEPMVFAAEFTHTNIVIIIIIIVVVVIIII